MILRERVDRPEILHLDSILLRRLFRVSVHNQLKEAGISLKPFKDELISLLKQPLELNLKKKIADAAAELDRRLIQTLCEYLSADRHPLTGQQSFTDRSQFSIARRSNSRGRGISVARVHRLLV